LPVLGSKNALCLSEMRCLGKLAFLLCVLSGCAATLDGPKYARHVPGLSEDRVLAATEHPALFLGPEPDAPAVGYTSSDLVVRVEGESRGGRVPVQVLGPLEVHAHVPVDLLTMRVQRRGRLRGTSLYVGPNDRVQVLGAALEPGRVRVRATAVLPGRAGPTFEGSYPAVGLGSQPAPVDAAAPDAGTPYELAAGLPLVLYEEPSGTVVTTLAPAPIALAVTVLKQEDGWFAVRIGSGPYLIGYTNASLREQSADAAVPTPPATDNAVPSRLVHEVGALKRVVPGTRLSFNDEPIAVLHAEAWARVLAEYPNGEVDAFVAVDDSVAVRGLLPKAALRDPPVIETASEAPVSETPSEAPVGEAPTQAVSETPRQAVSETPTQAATP